MITLVLFYENTEELVTTVAQFVVDGVMADETSIVVATSQHIAAFEDAMVSCRRRHRCRTREAEIC